MNNTRRKQINDIIEQTKSIQSNIEEILIDEETALDNMPENLKDSDKAFSSQVAIDNLDLAYDTFDDLIDYLTESVV